MTNSLNKTLIVFITGVFLCTGVLCSCSKKKDDKKASTEDNVRQTHSKDSTQVDVIVLKQSNFKKQLASNGKLRAKTKATLSFKTSGIVDKIYVANGSYVKKDEIVATLNTEEAIISYKSSELSMRKAEIDLSDAIIGFGYTGMEDTLTPFETMELAKLRSGYTSNLLSFERAKLAIEACTLRAPFSGKIADLKGYEYGNGSGEFCSLIDDSRMIVDFSILETEYDFVKPGQIIKVESFFDAENNIEGRIITVNPSIDKNGQIIVEAEVPNKGSYIDGMNVKLYIEKDIPDQLVVPKSAVVIRDNLQVLFTYSNGKANWVYVETLMENSDSYAVRANKLRGAELHAGDTVITDGNLNLSHNAPVVMKK